MWLGDETRLLKYSNANLSAYTSLHNHANISRNCDPPTFRCLLPLVETCPLPLGVHMSPFHDQNLNRKGRWWSGMSHRPADIVSHIYRLQKRRSDFYLRHRCEPLCCARGLEFGSEWKKPFFGGGETFLIGYSSSLVSHPFERAYIYPDKQ